MLQVLKKLSRVVTDPIASISTLAKATIEQHEQIEALTAKVDRLSRTALLLCMGQKFVNQGPVILALQSDKPIDLTVVFSEGLEEGEMSFTVKIIQGQTEQPTQWEERPPEPQPITFGSPVTARTSPAGPTRSRSRD